MVQEKGRRYTLTADINQFKSAFSKASKIVKASTENIRQLNRSLRFDSNNLGALSQKFTNLKAKLEATENQAKSLHHQIKTLERLKLKDITSFNTAGGNAYLDKLKAKLNATRTEVKSLNKELSQVDNALKNQAVNAKLSKLNADIKSATGNVDKLSQSLRFRGVDKSLSTAAFKEFSRTVSLSTDKVEILKRQLAKIDANVDVAEFVRLNRQIDETESNVRRLKSSLNNVGSLGGLSGAMNKLDSLGKRMYQNGMVATYGWSVPVGMASSRVVSSFIETDDVFRRVSSAGVKSFENLTSASNEFSVNISAVRDKAREISTGSVYSMREVASGMEMLVKAGWDVSDAGNEVAHVMNMAAVEGMELAEASEIVSDGLNAFGMSANETQKFVDILTRASVESTIGIRDVGETMKYAAPIAGQLGFSLEDTAVAMAVMGNQGIKASVAGTSLRAGFTNLIAGSSGAKQALKELGIEMTDHTGKVRPLRDIIDDLRVSTKNLSDDEKTVVAQRIFGKTAMSGWSAILKADDESYRKVASSINAYNGVTKTMADQMNSGVGGAFRRFQATMSNASYEISSKLSPAITTLLDKLSGLFKWFSSLDSSTLVVISSLVGLSVVIPPIVMGFGLLFSSGAKIVKLFTSLKSLKSVFKFAGLSSDLASLTSGLGLASKSLSSFDGSLKKSSVSTLGFKSALSSLGLYLTAGSLVAEGVTYLKDNFTQLGRMALENKEHFAKVGANFDKLGDAIVRYNDRLANTKSLYDLTTGSFAAEMSNFSHQLQEAHNGITSVIESHYKTRSSWTDAELSSVRSWLLSISEAGDGLAATVSSKLEQLNATIANFTNDDKISTESYVMMKDKSFKSLSEIYDKGKADLDDWFAKAMEINTQLPESERRTTAEIVAEFESRKHQITQKMNDGFNALSESLTKRYNLEEDFFNKFKFNKQNIEAESERHRQEIDRINQDYVFGSMKHQQALELENAKHKQNMQAFTDAIKNIGDQKNFNMLAEWTQSIATTIQKGGELSEANRLNAQAIVSAYDLMPDDVKAKFEDMLNKAGITFDELKESVKEKAKATGNETVQSIQDGILEKEADLYQQEIDLMNRANEGANSVDFSNVGSSSMEDVQNAIYQATGSVTSAASDVMDDAYHQADGVDFSGVGSSAMADTSGAISSMSGDVSSAASSVMDGAKSSAGSVSFWNVGWGIIEGIGSGISAGWDWLTGLVSNLASSLFSAAKSMLGINSPSRVFRDGIGQWIPAGLGEGVKNNMDTAIKPVKFMVDKLAKAVNTSALSDSVNSVLSTDVKLNHSISQNGIVVDTLNRVIDRINNLELRSDIILDGQKLGQATYKEHLNIERRLSY